MDKATKKLLEDHQAIIDAWFERWRQQQQERIDVLWAKKRGNR